MPEEQEEKAIDETVPGGRYVRGDEVVNAEGEVIKGLSVKDGQITGTEKSTEPEPSDDAGGIQRQPSDQDEEVVIDPRRKNR